MQLECPAPKHRGSELSWTAATPPPFRQSICPWCDALKGSLLHINLLHSAVPDLLMLRARSAPHCTRMACGHLSTEKIPWPEVHAKRGPFCIDDLL